MVAPRADGRDTSHWQQLSGVPLTPSSIFDLHKASQGPLSRDTKFARFTRLYRAAGTRHVGAYHYLLEGDPRGQADNYSAAIAATGAPKIDFHVVDWEGAPKRPAASVATVEAFCALLDDRYGPHRVAVYSADWVTGFATWRSRNPDRALFYPNYNVGTTAAGGWAKTARWNATVWQWTGKGTDPGFTTPLDLNHVLKPEWFAGLEAGGSTVVDDSMRVPFGYGTQTRSLGELRTWLLVHHHPEYVRRLIPWLASKGGVVGVGGGWRATGAQPNKPGFAPEGKSFHQDQRFADGFVGAAAVDLVAADGPDGNNVHDMVAWSMVPRKGSAEAARWGLHCNVSTESWHMQPTEFSGYDSWVRAGRPAPAAGYQLPDDPTPTPAPVVFDPARGLFGLWPLNPSKPVIRLGATGDAVRYLQGVVKVTVDGQFGARTGAAVRALQTVGQVTVDGIVGRNTWPLVDRLAVAPA